MPVMIRLKALSKSPGVHKWTKLLWLSGPERRTRHAPIQPLTLNCLIIYFFVSLLILVFFGSLMQRWGFAPGSRLTTWPTDWLWVWPITAPPSFEAYSVPRGVNACTWLRYLLVASQRFSCVLVAPHQKKKKRKKKKIISIQSCILKEKFSWQLCMVHLLLGSMSFAPLSVNTFNRNIG